jgi:hypothetical protein
MQMREVIWKWDVLDSSNDYPLPKSKDFISSYPLAAIWQELSNIETIINLMNNANEWRNPAVLEEWRGNENLHRFYPEA